MNNNKPTISIVITVRNEINSIKDTMDKLLALDYPKIEILIYDDVSEDKTSSVIKKYAHAGIRFVEGARPESPWLGRNFGVKRLIEQASGEYILLIDSDKPISDSGIRHLFDIESDVVTLIEPTSAYKNNLTKLALEPLLPRAESFLKPTVFFASRDKLSELFKSTDEGLKTTLNLQLYCQNEIGYNADVYYDKTRDDTEYFEFAKNRDFYIRKLYPSLKRSSLITILAILAYLLVVAIFLIFQFIYVAFTLLFMFTGPLLIELFLGSPGVLGHHRYSSKYQNLNMDIKENFMEMLVVLILGPFKAVYTMYLMIVSMIKYKKNDVSWRGRKIGLN